MTGWTPERVRSAAADWVWVPDDAREVLKPDYHLVAYPEAFAIPTQVAWCRSERRADVLVEEVLRTVRAWGRDDVSFWVGEDTRPGQLAEELTRRGAEHVESVEVLARELSEPADPVGGADLEVRRVLDEQMLRAAAFAAAEDGQPAACGGSTLTGEVARMWGAATRPAYRGRGAYRSVLAERMRLARERGAILALVKGLTTTSAPILRRLGFTGHGLVHRYRLSVDPHLIA